MNPYTVVSEFEQRLADWCGSPYCVAVESGSAAIFLSLQWMNRDKIFDGLSLTIPSRTYPSAAASIIHAGMKVEFKDVKWEGEYAFEPLNVYDAALRLKKGMYKKGLQCLSFHVKKLLPVGRGGAILLNDKKAYEWLKMARFDGRQPVPLQEQKEFTVLGYNMYMEPSIAARAIQLFEVYRAKYPNGAPDLKVSEQGYADLSKHKIFHQPKVHIHSFGDLDGLSYEQLPEYIKKAIIKGKKRGE